MKSKTVAIFAFMILITLIFPVDGELNLNDFDLPPPISVDTILEESIFRRMSIREFTDDPITDKELSTVLWAAYGMRIDGKKTVSGINYIHAGIIYVLKEEAAYKYDPMNHSLTLYKEGDYRDIVGWQYEAPIQLGLCWNTDKLDANYGSGELGQMGQNIYLMANALELGTVVCGQDPPAIEPLGIPPNEKGLIVMPLGHPIHEYNFINRPLWISLLPRIEKSSISLTTALIERIESTTFDGELTREEMSHLLWSSYGFSSFLDKSDQGKNNLKRHRTVPSAHGYYPLKMYAIRSSGIYQYYPNVLTKIYPVPVGFLGLPIVTYMLKIKNGDYREEIANLSSENSVVSAPLSIVSVLDVNMTRPKNRDDLSGEALRKFWYYEAGSSVHNVLLEATALELSSNFFPVQNKSDMCSLLGLEQDYFDPLFVVTIGE